MTKKYYYRPETEAVYVKGVAMGTIYYYGKTESGDFNTANQGEFDQDDDSESLPASSYLWEEK